MTAPEGPNAVYRAYDADMALLYVGITGNLSHRMRHHARLSPWWPEVVAMSAVWYRNRSDVLDAEALAIADENPRYNRTCSMRPDVVPEALPFKPQHEQPDMTVPPMAEWDAAVEVARMLGRKSPYAEDLRWARRILGAAMPHILAEQTAADVTESAA